jgi:hypothetical protein
MIALESLRTSTNSSVAVPESVEFHISRLELSLTAKARFPLLRVKVESLISELDP